MEFKEKIADIEQKIAHKRRQAEIKAIAKEAHQACKEEKICENYGGRVFQGYMCLAARQHDDAEAYFTDALTGIQEFSIWIHADFFKERALAGLERVVEKIMKLPAKEAEERHYRVAERAIQTLKKYHPKMQEQAQ